MCPLAGICSTLKFDFTQISVIFSIRRKKLGIKKVVFPVDKKLVFISWNERLAEKYVPVEEKTTSTGSSWLLYEKMEENGFHEPENQSSLFKICSLF